MTKLEIREDTRTKLAYAVDASIYQIEPAAVILPRNEAEVQEAVLWAKQKGLSVTARGAGTSVTGASIGAGVVLDCARYMNKILEIDVEKRLAKCQPGVVQDDLNRALKPFGLRLGPDTSTGSRATLGGMYANNSAGAHSIRYGMMADHVLAARAVLASGEVLALEENSQLAKQARGLAEEKREAILHHFPKLKRRVAGYNCDSLLEENNLIRLFASSEGTLGVITELTVRLVPVPKCCALVVLHFSDLLEGLSHCEAILESDPYALELIDEQIINFGRLSPTMKGKLGWIAGEPKGLLVVEFEGQSVAEVDAKLAAFDRVRYGYAQVVLREETDMAKVWQLRQSGLGLLLSKRSYSRALAFIEDVTVPPKHLSSFMRQLTEYLQSQDKEAGIYGHAGAGCIHVRPFVDLRRESELELMKEMMLDVAQLVRAHEGTLSGEHGDGLIRSWLNETMFGQELYALFCQIKGLFDPENRLNPGKIVHPEPVDAHLRMHPQSRIRDFKTFLNFEPEGGFALSADLCNGNARCRQKSQLMCPSFQAFGDEAHTTRARAQTLRALVHGHEKVEDFSSKAIQDALDLCLECKGCKAECPSQVDMAKMKSEVLYQHGSRKGYSLRSWMLASVSGLSRLASKMPRLAHFFMNAKVGKWLLGLATSRNVPKIAKTRFTRLFEPKTQGKRIVLFADTYAEFNEPHVAESAVKVLRACGYEPIVPRYTCCGRPSISKGFLPDARKKAHAVLDVLWPYLEEELEIVVLEPSCCSAFRDDYVALVDKANRPLAAHLAKNVLSFDELMAKIWPQKSALFPLQKDIAFHTHCHQKALVGTGPTQAVLGATAKAIDAGCCGLAGSFGYEKEHYEMSVAIANGRLMPAVEKASGAVCASGFSCRTQIRHLQDSKQPLHLAEVLAEALI